MRTLLATVIAAVIVTAVAIANTYHNQVYDVPAAGSNTTLTLRMGSGQTMNIPANATIRIKDSSGTTVTIPFTVSPTQGTDQEGYTITVTGNNTFPVDGSVTIDPINASGTSGPPTGNFS